MKIFSDCSNFEKLPDISIILKSRESYKSKKLKNTKITLTPEDYVFDGKEVQSKINKNKSKFIGKIECEAALMAIDVPPPRGPLLVFGDLFLKKFYTVFDRDEKVIGISVANHQLERNTEKYKIETPYDEDRSDDAGMEMDDKIEDFESEKGEPKPEPEPELKRKISDNNYKSPPNMTELINQLYDIPEFMSFDD